VIIVGLVALLVGGLLNAAGIRKTALGQDVGTKRDVSKFFADPLYDVSHFLHTDQLRVGLKNVLGRGGDESKVAHWLETGAGVAGFVGFAVGRTIWWDALERWLSDGDADEAAETIAARYRRLIDAYVGAAV